MPAKRDDDLGASQSPKTGGLEDLSPQNSWRVASLNPLVLAVGWSCTDDVDDDNAMTVCQLFVRY